MAKDLAALRADLKFGTIHDKGWIYVNGQLAARKELIEGTIYVGSKGFMVTETLGGGLRMHI